MTPRSLTGRICARFESIFGPGQIWGETRRWTIHRPEDQPVINIFISRHPSIGEETTSIWIFDPHPSRSPVSYQHLCSGEQQAEAIIQHVLERTTANNGTHVGT